MMKCKINDNCSPGRLKLGYCSKHYSRLKKHGDPLKIGKSGRIVSPNRGCSVNGCDRKHRAHGFCGMHEERWQRTGDPGPANKLRRDKGSIWIDKDSGYAGLTVDGIQYKHHRYVMEQHLGRELLPNENVHHINGNKVDNRIENLELWSTHQPRGQRIEDKVKYAKEILEMYETNWVEEYKEYMGINEINFNSESA